MEFILKRCILCQTAHIKGFCLHRTDLGQCQKNLRTIQRKKSELRRCTHFLSFKMEDKDLQNGTGVMACIAALILGIVDIVLAQNSYKECRPLDIDGPKIHNCQLDPNETPAEGEEPCTMGNIPGLDTSSIFSYFLFVKNH